jgi:hypothetical protein
MRTRLIALGIILMLVGATTIFAQGGLVARYTFAVDFKDTSGNDLNGVPFGNATIVYDAQRHKNVVDLDGTSGTYVHLGNDTLFNWHSTGWTATFWIKLRSWEGQNWCTALKKSNCFTFERDVSADKLGFYQWPNFAPTDVDLTPDSSWHHIAATLDGAAQSIYLDGQLWKSVPNAGNFTTDTTSVLLGSAEGTSRFINARFDDVRLYNTALTADQIANLAGYKPPSPDLFAHYTFSTNFSDTSTNHLDAIASGNAKLVYDAKRGKNVADLDGSNGTFLRLGNDTLFNWHSTGWTAAFWIKLRSWGGQNWCTVLKKSNSFSLERDVSADKLAFYHWPNFAPTSVDLMPDSTWHHVCATLDGATQSIYLDGQLWKAVPNAGNFATDTTSVYLGAAEGTSRFVNAQFDDVRLYKKALNADEVAKLAGYTPTKSTLVARYTFSTNFTDTSGHNLNGLAVGNAKIVYDAARGKNVADLDGTNGTFVRLGNDTLFNWHGAWTATFWIKLRSWNAQNWCTVLKKANAYSFERNIGNDQLAFYSWPNFTSTAAPLVADSTWHHVAVTLDGTNQILYLDGNVAASKANAGNFMTDTNAVILGSAEGTSRFINARFDDLRFYSEALSSSEIRQMAGSPPVIGDVVMFHFDSNFQNSAATGDTATPHGTVSFVPGMTGKGMAAYLHNTTSTDNSYLSFPDMQELHITGSMTIQGWFKYADTVNATWCNPAYLVSKADPMGKYNFAVWTNVAGPSVAGGYSGANQGQYVGDPTASATLPSRDAFVNQWYRFVYQRDSTLRVVSVAVFDTAGNLVKFSFRQSHPAYDLAAAASTMPVLFGRSRSVGTNYFNGYLDDIQISNKLTALDVPPVILYPQYLSDPVYSHKIGNQDESLSQYPVSVYIKVLGNPTGVASAKVRYRTVTDPYEKVDTADVRWQEVSMAKGANDLWTGNIPAQPLTTVIDYYIKATSTTGKIATMGANPDSVYDRFGVWRPHDKVLKLSFEEVDLNFKDSTIYDNKLNKLGDWVIWDDPGSQIEGQYCAYLPQGGFGVGEIISPFLSMEEYTVTAWIKPVPNAPLHNTYILSMTAGSYDRSIPFVSNSTHPWSQQNYTFLQRYTQIKNDIYHENRWPDEFPYHGDRSFVKEDTLGVWTHYLVSAGPDSIVVQRNNALDQPVERQVYKGPLGNGWEHPFKPFAPSIGRFRIGPPGPPDGDPFYSGYIDDVEIYNYQTLPGKFAGPVTGIAPTAETGIPVKYDLSQNYPNPFNPSTTLKYAIAHEGKVQMMVYNVLGQRVATLVDDVKKAGYYEVRFDARNLASGVYFCRLTAGTYVNTKKLMLLK